MQNRGTDPANIPPESTQSEVQNIREAERSGGSGDTGGTGGSGGNESSGGKGTGGKVEEPTWKGNAKTALRVIYIAFAIWGFAQGVIGL